MDDLGLGEYAICEVITRHIPLEVVASDDSILSLERSTNGEMIACSPKTVSPRESNIEDTNGRDDVDWVGFVLRDLENNGRLKMLNLVEDLDCLELWELSFAMSIRARYSKR